MTPEMTTLCYIEQEGKYLMLHRVKKERDINKDKWIGIGGHFEGTESPEDCLLREVREETGLTLTRYRFRGIVTFLCGDCFEYMCLYTADGFTGELEECDEGTLEWVEKEKVYGLDLWAGDKLFFRLLEEDRPFFSLKLTYKEDGTLLEAVLDGKKMELLDVLLDTPDEGMGDGEVYPIGAPETKPESASFEVLEVQERDTVHFLGLLHATVHMWVVRRDMSGGWEVLCQKRSMVKDSNPGCWDISSAGHMDTGDTREEAAVRELYEELGITAKPEELEYIGYTRRKTMKPFQTGMLCDNQISYVHVYRGEVDTDILRLQYGEVDEVSWIMLDEVIRRTLEDPGFKQCFNPKELFMLLEYLSHAN